MSSTGIAALETILTTDDLSILQAIEALAHAKVESIQLKNEQVRLKRRIAEEDERLARV